MKIRMYGTRGSIATPSDSEATTSEFGGNTTCVHLLADGHHILDLGTGARKLGQHLMKQGFAKGAEARVYFTHMHLDHSTGIGFFVPAYIPANNITLYGEAKIQKIKAGLNNLKAEPHLSSVVSQSDRGTTLFVRNGVREALAQQLVPALFPVSIDAMKGLKQFVDFTPGNGPIYETERLCVETQPVNHPGGCVAYKFTERTAAGDKVFVFNTDFEPDGIDDKIIRLWHNADLVVADGQYEPPGTKDTPNPFMPGWGHSSWKQDIDLAARAGAKRLLLTHHEPKMEDNYHRDLEARAQAYAAATSPQLSVALAREGAEYEL